MIDITIFDHNQKILPVNHEELIFLNYLCSMIMWLILLLSAAFIVWFLPKNFPSKAEREQSAHDKIRKKTTARVLSQEKNLHKSPSSRGITALPRTKRTKPQKSQYRDGYPVTDLDLDITYEDADGEITFRQISVLRYDPVIKKINAWCHLRRGTRTFYTPRVIQAIDVTTGEVVSDVHDYIVDRLDS
ncbi:hypothetical protein [Escherichia coli]|uniref:hypothetical protein n=1 Tax=Escherichia coli TaxID=562 RepID=UPI001917FBE3|nr:hypothetical protein [Escherichia coli]EIH0550771.1 hypothetical protein [Escherichia coli]HAV8513112.1 hypothetical protein [Escherichia coli]